MCVRRKNPKKGGLADAFFFFHKSVFLSIIRTKIVYTTVDFDDVKTGEGKEGTQNSG